MSDVTDAFMARHGVPDTFKPEILGAVSHTTDTDTPTPRAHTQSTHPCRSRSPPLLLTLVVAVPVV